MGISRGYGFSSTVTLPYPAHSTPKANILINNNGHACLTGFSLLTIASDQSNVTSSGRGTIQWMSPELLVPDEFGLDGRSTEASDCYALGMVIYEVLSGQTPFAQHSLLAVTWKVVKGERPERPQGAQGMWFTDSIWETLELCWKPQPGDRIGAKTVLLGLEEDSGVFFSLFYIWPIPNPPCDNRTPDWV